MKAMTRRERFFWKWSGWSYDPTKETKAQGRRRCAKELAEAEQWLEQEIEDGNATVEWVPDDMPWDGPGQVNEVLGCIITVGDQTTSLWGIGDPTPEYQRVVQAELAIEARVDMFDQIAERIRQL